MTDAVRDSYDARAKEYASFNLNDLDRVPLDRERLRAFARLAFPDSKFQLGDLTSSDIADSSLAGIVARYSLIHVAPAQLTSVFGELFRVLRPRAPVLVSFFASSSSVTHGLPFDHAVVTAHALFPETVVAQMQTVGFNSFEVSTRKPLDAERLLDHGTILARRGSS
jgi:SAM-dependent methyltransferase